MQILGVRLDNVKVNEALERVRGFLFDNQQHLVASVNPEMLVLAQKDLEFRQVLNKSDLNIADGTGVVFASYFLGAPLPQRIPGVDFVWQLCELAEKEDKKIFLLGGGNGVAAVAVSEITKRFPNLKIASGGDNLKFDDPTLIILVNNFAPQILLVAFGHGRQEKWLAKNLAQLPSVDVGMGVGGTFDFMAGRVRRAPKFFRVLGLEWSWRLITQPWRLKRIFTATAHFCYLVVKSRIKNNESGSRKQDPPAGGFSS